MDDHRKRHELIIGDAGFKGLPNEADEIDLGYGVSLKVNVRKALHTRLRLEF